MVLIPEGAEAQSPGRAVLSGTVTDPTGAVIRGAAAHLESADPPVRLSEQERKTDPAGEFSFTAQPGVYVLTVEAEGFAAYTSRPLALKPSSPLRLPVRLLIASQHEEVSILEEDGASDPNSLFGAIVLDGEKLKTLSDDSATLREQLNALAGGFGQPSFLIDGFSGGRLPPKSSIRSIRINRNPYSAYFAELGFGRVEISTKPGTDRLHGSLEFSGTDQPLDAPNPYTTVQAPFHDFQQDATIDGPLGKRTAIFLSDAVENLANTSVVNAADPLSLTTTVSTLAPAPLQTYTYSARIDRQFSPANFAYLRDEWSETHIENNGIAPLVLPIAAYGSSTLTNAVQISDTQVISAHAVNESRFQYLRTRVRQDPNSTLPSVIVEGAFQEGGSPAQAIRDNQDAYEVQDLFDFDRGRHSLRMGFRFRELRDANESSAGFNGQYIFPDVSSYPAQPTQFSYTVGQQGAVLRTDDLAVYAEDDWKVTPNLTFSYGLRFESESAIPDHSDPAPRLGLAWAVRPGKRKTPIITLRGGYGLFYDRFPAAQLLQAIRQNGTRETAFVEKDPSFNPFGAPAVADSSAAQPTIYRVDPSLRTSYGQVTSFTALRSFGRYGAVSGNLIFLHNTHNYLTRNINAPLPGTFDPGDPASGTRPLGTPENVYQFSSAANGNAEHFFVSYRLQLGTKLFAFGTFDTEKNYNETDGITSFPSKQYDVRQDYARTSTDRARSFTGSLEWTLPHGFQVSPYLDVRSGLPFDITTGADLNGDTIYNDRPGVATDPSRASVVPTPLGSFDVTPAPGQPVIRRNYGTAPGYLWVQLRAGKDFHIGPRPSARATGPGGNPAPVPDRPWDLNFGVEVHNLTNHNNPGLPVGVLSAQACGSGKASPCVCPQGVCPLLPSPYFGHSLSLATDFSPITGANRTILLQTSFTF